MHRIFVLFSLFFLQVSGRFFPLNRRNPMVNKGTNLVEAWEKVLVTSGYTDYAISLWTYGPNCVFQKLIAKFLPSPVIPSFWLQQNIAKWGRNHGYWSLCTHFIKRAKFRWPWHQGSSNSATAALLDSQPIRLATRGKHEVAELSVTLSCSYIMPPG